MNPATSDRTKNATIQLDAIPAKLTSRAGYFTSIDCTVLPAGRAGSAEVKHAVPEPSLQAHRGEAFEPATYHNLFYIGLAAGLERRCRIFRFFRQRASTRLRCRQAHEREAPSSAIPMAVGAPVNS